MSILIPCYREGKQSMGDELSHRVFKSRTNVPNFIKAMGRKYIIQQVCLWRCSVLHWESDLYFLWCSVLICEMEIIGYIHVRIVVKINT